MLRCNCLAARLSGLVLILLATPRAGRGAEIEETPEATAPGLVASYYRLTGGELFGWCHTLDTFPDVLADQKPVLARVETTPEIIATAERLPDTKLLDNFYVRWSGKIRIARDDVYIFSTSSDDGSRLYIDGKLVVDNGGQHILSEVSGRVALKAGDHDLGIEYFDSAASAEMRVEWARGNGAKTLLPVAALRHSGGCHGGQRRQKCKSQQLFHWSLESE